MVTNRPAVAVETQGHVMVVTIDRPEVSNAINLEAAQIIGRALEKAEDDKDVWVVILTGRGTRAFCAGADLKALARGEQMVPSDPTEQSWGFAGYVAHPISKPRIAAVNGFALGGGTEIALASDLIVASEDALFGLPEVKQGIYAAAGGAFRLPEQLPKKVAMEMILTGEPIGARRARELGFCNRVVTADSVLDVALDLAERICRNAPLAVQASKRIADGIVEGTIEAEVRKWEISESEGTALLQTQDAQEGPRAFMEKRSPQWRAE